METEKLLMKPEEVAHALGISRARAYELLASGDLPAVRIGRTVRVAASALKAWVAERSEKREAVS